MSVRVYIYLHVFNIILNTRVPLEHHMPEVNHAHNHHAPAQAAEAHLHGQLMPSTGRS